MSLTALLILVAFFAAILSGMGAYWIERRQGNSRATARRSASFYVTFTSTIVILAYPAHYLLWMIASPWLFWPALALAIALVVYIALWAGYFASR